jgi:hypothetical protein
LGRAAPLLAFVRSAGPDPDQGREARNQDHCQRAQGDSDEHAPSLPAFAAEGVQQRGLAALAAHRVTPLRALASLVPIREVRGMDGPGGSTSLMDVPLPDRVRPFTGSSEAGWSAV